MGTLVSLLGISFSPQLDLPTGATIVCTFALVLIAMAVIKPLLQRTWLQSNRARSCGLSVAS